MSSCNVVRTHTYAHPQHMNVVKLFFKHQTLMPDQSGLGLQPQSLHFTISYCLGDDTPNSSKIP